MASYNKVILIGRLTADPELRYTPSGKAVAKFRLAVDRRANARGERETDFINIVAWQKLAVSCADHLLKGSSVYIEGELRSRTIDNGSGAPRNIIEIRASHIQFLDKKRIPEEEADYLANGEILPIEDMADQEEL